MCLTTYCDCPNGGGGGGNGGSNLIVPTQKYVDKIIELARNFRGWECPVRSQRVVGPWRGKRELEGHCFFVITSIFLSSQRKKERNVHTEKMEQFLF